jgi:dimethylamine monooxygenase subunit A
MSHLTPAADMPWPISAPFRMRPGLSRLATSDPEAATPPLFVRDAQAAAYAAGKRAVLQAQPRRAPVGEADPAALAAIAQAYAAQTGVSLAPEAEALALGLQEDFVVLHDGVEDGGHTMRTRFLSVCFPSNWNPAEKLGMDFAAIHAPVADNALLQAGARGIIDTAFRQAPMLRHVWLLTPNGDLAQHPETRRTRWQDVLAAADAPGASGRLLDQVFFRVERQTTLPLPALRRGVFFIRVMVAPLTGVLALAPGRAGELAEALASMSEAVIAYRGMTAVRERLCAELRPS